MHPALSALLCPALPCPALPSTRPAPAPASGTRSPLGIFLHAAWLLARPEHADQLNRFLDYALGFEDVRLATVSQVGGPHVGGVRRKGPCLERPQGTSFVGAGRRTALADRAFSCSSLNPVLALLSPQVLAWMEDPVPADEWEPPCPTPAELQARLPGGRLICPFPAGGCGHVSLWVEGCLVRWLG